MTTMYVPGVSVSVSTSDTVSVDASAVSSDMTRLPDKMPLSIPSGQAYYWSIMWQDDVRASIAALEAGDYADFDTDDPNDVVRWLLSEED